MAQKINVNTLRLKKKLMWWSISHYNIINTNFSKSGLIIFHEDLLIRKLIEGVFKSFNILVSEIIISRSPISTNIEDCLQHNRDINKNKISISFLVNNFNNSKTSSSNIRFGSVENSKNTPSLNIKGIEFNHNSLLKEKKYKYIGIITKNLLIELINRLNNKKLCDIEINIKEVKNPSYNVKLLADWITWELSQNTNTLKKHKNILKNVNKLLNE